MDCTVLITHFQTPDLLDTAVRSFKSHYPGVGVVVADNRSASGSSETLGRLETDFRESVTVLRLDRNHFDGPALDMVVRSRVATPYVFALDSDTETRRGGFLERMIDRLEDDERNYACGRVLRVNKRGFVAEDGKHKVCWLPYALFKRCLYLTLPPFEHHGAPNLRNCTAAIQRGLRLIDFPIADYVFHRGRGTIERFGYGLGIRGQVSAILNRFGL